MRMKTCLILLLVIFSELAANARQEELRTLRQFSKIVTKEGYDIFLTEGASESVRIVTENIDPEKILTDVSNETLTIGTRKGKYMNTKVQLYITFKRLNSIVSYGSGMIKIAPFKTDKISMELMGSNKVIIPVHAKTIDLNLSGSSDVSLSGGTDRLLINLSGSGKINAFDLDTREGMIKLSGSGEANVNVKERLKIDSSGSGTVNYKGHPQNKEINKTGSGNVEPAKD